jgi:hypothetical protein
MVNTNSSPSLLDELASLRPQDAVNWPRRFGACPRRSLMCQTARQPHTFSACSPTSLTQPDLACGPVPTMVARMEQDPNSDNECIRLPKALSEALLVSDWRDRVALDVLQFPRLIIGVV